MLKGKIFKKGISILSVGAMSVSGILSSANLQVSACQEGISKNPKTTEEKQNEKIDSRGELKKAIEWLSSDDNKEMKELLLEYDDGKLKLYDDSFFALKKILKKLKNKDISVIDDINVKEELNDIIREMQKENFLYTSDYGDIISYFFDKFEILQKNMNSSDEENTSIVENSTDDEKQKGNNDKTEIENLGKILYLNADLLNWINNCSKITDQKQLMNNENKKDNNAKAGIQNLGNSCYLNAALQQLYANTEFRNAVLAKNWDNESQKMLSFLKVIFTKLQNGKTVGTDIMKISESLGLYSGDQQDSLDYYNKIKDRVITEDKNLNFLPENYYLFSVSEEKSLEKMIYDMAECSWVRIPTESNYLNFVIPRGDLTGKISTKIDIDKKLKIGYNLKAVTVQIGNVSCGHYVAFVYNSNNDTWTLFDDSYVQENLRDDSKVSFFGKEGTVLDLISRNATMATYEKAN